ncbi:hypothetical protein F5880DRAFT_674377 [Lentinula raphanica]|nr:hypothetical protein F5880DRAFT_674377 [Lentinula raphanica]
MSLLQFEFYEPLPSELSPSHTHSQESPPRKIIKASRACDHCRKIRVRCTKPHESTSCKRCLNDNKECTMSERHQQSHIPGPKRGGKGKKTSSACAFDEERNWIASDFEDQRSQTQSSTLLSVSDQRNPNPNLATPNLDPANILPLDLDWTIDTGSHGAESGPTSERTLARYSFEEQGFSNSANDFGTDNPTDLSTIEGHNVQPEGFPNDLYPMYNAWIGRPVSMHFSDESYDDDILQQYWSQSYHRNV